MRRLALLSLLLLAAACGPKQGTAPASASATTSARVDPASIPDVVKLKGAAGKSGARYANPLAAFDMPDEAKNMSDYSEYGWREAITDQGSDAFKKFGPTPAGWWVYVKPYWIVYNLKDGKTGP